LKEVMPTHNINQEDLLVNVVHFMKEKKKNE
jgi:hypothetical protein